MNENERLEQEESEQCFLGSLLSLADPKDAPQLKIKPHYFSITKNGKIFQAYQKQIAANIVPDIMTLCHDPDLAGIGKDYIASLNDKILSAVNLQLYENEIIDLFNNPRNNAIIFKWAEERRQRILKKFFLSGCTG